MWTAKAQISLGNHAVWSGTSLSANRISKPGMNLNMCILHMLEDTFIFGVAHIALDKIDS